MKIPFYLLLMLAPALFTGCQGEEPHKKEVAPPPAVEVQAHTVTIREGLLWTEIVGTIQAVNKAVIAAKITGTIVDLPVVLGSKVQAGDLLVTISAEEISAKVIQAQAQLEQARRNLERERKLLRKNAATAENVKSLDDIFRVSEASYREVQTMLSYATITAPFTGVVSSKMAHVGDLATPGTPLLRLENTKNLQVVTSVPESLVQQVRFGDMLTVTIPSANLTLQGKVAEVAPAADPLSRTATVKINLDEDAQLRSGQFSRVFIPGKSQASLFVPLSSLHILGQIEQIFIIAGNKAHLRLVRTGAIIDDQIEILSGLEPGEVIAISTGSRLIDGQPVTVVQ